MRDEGNINISLPPKKKIWGLLNMKSKNKGVEELNITTFP